MKPRFTMDDMIRANEEWGANCGPGAIAAIMGMTLDEVRPHMGDFEKKHYTNPSLMWSALRSLGVSWKKADELYWPQHGLVRIQWHGPWTAKNAPPRWAYRYTHWVAAKRGSGSTGIFDINALANGSGWCSSLDWVDTVVPFITSDIPRANGEWSITHSVEVERQAARQAA